VRSTLPGTVVIVESESKEYVRCCYICKIKKLNIRMREIILTKSNRWFQNESREYKEIGFTHVIKHEQIVRSEHMLTCKFILSLHTVSNLKKKRMLIKNEFSTATTTTNTIATTKLKFVFIDKERWKKELNFIILRLRENFVSLFSRSCVQILHFPCQEQNTKHKRIKKANQSKEQIQDRQRRSFVVFILL